MKYVLFLAWGAWDRADPVRVWGSGAELSAWRGRWRGLLLGLLWVGPSLYFSFMIFAGNAGLIFPLLPLLYLAAARGCKGSSADDVPGRPSPQCCCWEPSARAIRRHPLRREKNQRDVILNVMFLRYSGSGHHKPV